VCARVVAARERQRARLRGAPVACNAAMDAALTRAHVPLGRAARARLGAATGVLSIRGQDRVLRLARTIADLDGRERVAAADVDEAIGYRVASAEAVAA
jgi:magnesium chelatase family protein